MIYINKKIFAGYLNQNVIYDSGCTESESIGY